MAQKIQDRLLAEFEQLAERAGLFLYTVDQASEWLIVDESDGIDTRLVVQHNFDRAGVKFKLAGQAVDRPDREFWMERKMFPQKGLRNRPTIEFWADYADGERLGKLRQLVTDLLAPYAAQLAALDAQLAGEPKGVQDVVRGRGAQVVEATRQTHASGAPDDVRYVLTVPGDREPRKLGPVGFEDAAHWAGQSLGNMVVGREMITEAREQGWARAEVGGAYSKLLPQREG